MTDVVYEFFLEIGNMYCLWWKLFSKNLINNVASQNFPFTVCIIDDGFKIDIFISLKLGFTFYLTKTLRKNFS